MLARFRTGPETTGSATPAASNHRDQVFQSSRRSNGNFSRSDARVMRLRAHELGAADRKQLLGAKPHGAEPGPIAVTVSNREVNLLTHEVDLMHGRGHTQIDVGMGLGKPTEPMHEPFGGKIGGCADRQDPGGLALYEAFRTHRDAIQCIADDREILTARLGHRQALALAKRKA